MRSVILAGVILVVSGFVAGVFVGTHSRSEAIGNVSAPEGVDMGPLWKAWQVIDEKFVPAAVATTTKVATTTVEKNQERVYGMIQGLAGSLGDPYTFFLPPVENTMFNADMSGSFEGVGMEIAVRDLVLTIVSPLKGSPAEAAGLKAGDQILKIDDASTQGMDISSAVQKIRGPKGSKVRLLIYREGWDAPKEYKVTRDTINVPIVDTEARPDGIFVISVHTFTSNAPDLFRSALRQFVNSGYTRLILDLRGNPGGYLEAAVQMASWFLPQGAKIVTEDYAGHERNVVHRSLGYNIFNDNLKMVVLVDRGSASASEILADALRYHGVAQLVGVNTFGKGSVQELIDITDNTALKITVARWLGPDGVQIPLHGIAPDVHVTISEEEAKEKKDPQMDKAVAILNAK